MTIMKLFRFLLLLIAAALLSACSSNKPNTPIAVHSKNPHYFMFRGKPTVLIGSTEHYGAVMNLDFDYVPYLDELAVSSLNVTRTFSGIYVEPANAFGILKNTMAPAAGRYICPWARSENDGYSNGGNKFDLTKWDDEYFSRLKDFITQAGIRDIVVELDLFSNFYDTLQWKLSPLNSVNNINGIGNIKDYKEILSLRHPEILAEQEKMVKKIITELKGFDNLYYEICNEPYFGDTLALREWEDHMTAIVADAEKDFAHHHLISHNVQNYKQLVPEPRKYVSIYNFHYAGPPVTVPMNYHLNLPLGDNETGFRGIADSIYRKEAWEFMLAGGGLFNHLDYSFTTDHEDGSYIIQKTEPGGGGKVLRQQFKILNGFMKSLNFINMKPIGDDVVKQDHAASIHGLVEDGKVWALYLSVKDTVNLSSSLELNLPSGSYNLTWIDTKTGSEMFESKNDHRGGWLQIKSPEYRYDIALRIKAK